MTKTNQTRGVSPPLATSFLTGASKRKEKTPFKYVHGLVAADGWRRAENNQPANAAWPQPWPPPEKTVSNYKWGDTMLIRNRLLFTLLFFIFSMPTCHVHAGPIELPACEGQACHKTAIKIDWPENRINHSSMLDVQRFRLIIPDVPRRVIQQLDNLTILHLENGTILSTSFISAYAPVTAKIPQNISFTISDAAQLPFFKTPIDPAPENEADQWVWRKSLLEKEQIFSGNKQAYWAENGNFKFFIVTEDISPTKKLNSVSAYLFDKKDKKSYVYIYGKNITYKDFLSIVSSVDHAF